MIVNESVTEEATETGNAETVEENGNVTLEGNPDGKENPRGQAEAKV